MILSFSQKLLHTGLKFLFIVQSETSIQGCCLEDCEWEQYTDRQKVKQEIVSLFLQWYVSFSYSYFCKIIGENCMGMDQIYPMGYLYMYGMELTLL